MTSHFSLSWDTYQSTMCSSFSLLQQNGDFVDLTLAADGHFVKVHQLILGIASPYIKELIQSAPCKHPVIFLNNVSYPTLCNILQFIYTGEAALAEEEIASFFDAARALQIRGIDNSNEQIFTSKPDVEDIKIVNVKGGMQTVKIKVNDQNLSHFEHVSIPVAAKNIKLTSNIKDKDNLNTQDQSKRFDSAESTEENEMMLEETLDDDTIDDNVSSEMTSNDNFELTRVESLTPSSYTNTKELQYTVSNRGSLQLILNRYVYNLFSKSNGGIVRRWRCVDYRDQKCLACTVTNGNVVVKRTNMHNHPYHDKKILNKIKKKAVFSAVKMSNTDGTSTS